MKKKCLGLAIVLAASGAHAKTQLSPQMVVDQVLERGLQIKKAEFEAQRSYFELEKALGVYDFNLKTSGSYFYDRSQSSLTDTTDLDRKFLFNTTVEKTFITGTQVALSYDNTSTNNRYSAFATNTTFPQQSIDMVGLALRQPIMRNFFGFSDRLKVEIAEQSVLRASEEREEEIEKILLEAMRSFWDAYVAQRQLQESTAARDKYETLVKNVRRKSGFNLSTPGELPRVEAEFNAAESRVKSASAAYLNAVDGLYTLIRNPSAPEDVEFVVSESLPDVPRLTPKPLGDLRPYRIQRNKVENAERSKSVAVNSVWPRLDIVAKAFSTGVEESRDRAVSEMVGGNYPGYYVGFEFETPFDSAVHRGTVADARVVVAQEQNEMLYVEERLRDTLRFAERDVTAKYTLAQNAIDSVEKRSRVVRELENAYRQGRQPLVELIRAYNEFFTAQQERARAIGDYHISLNALAAERDELVNNRRSQ